MSARGGVEASDMATVFAPLPAPQQLEEEYPVSRSVAEALGQCRRRLMDIITGQSDRLIIVIGPCSVHDVAAVEDYAQQLMAVRRELAEARVRHGQPTSDQCGDRTLGGDDAPPAPDPDIEILLRLYCEKPRTGAGWKGLIRDPMLDGSYEMALGLRQTRQLLQRLASPPYWFHAAVELLDPLVVPYIADLVAWATVGARTAESQIHREVASSLSSRVPVGPSLEEAPIPVGFKNATSGSVTAAMEGVLVAARPQCFLGIDATGAVAAVRSRGNPYGHIVLRGGHHHVLRGKTQDQTMAIQPIMQTNYQAEAVSAIVAKLKERYLLSALEEAQENMWRNGPANDAEAREGNAPPSSPQIRFPSVLIDCSHDNSGRDYRQQPKVAAAVAEQVAAAPHRNNIIGIMLESFRVPGKKSLQRYPSSPGQRTAASASRGAVGRDMARRIATSMERFLSINSSKDSNGDCLISVSSMPSVSLLPMTARHFGALNTSDESITATNDICPGASPLRATDSTGGIAKVEGIDPDPSKSRALRSLTYGQSITDGCIDVSTSIGVVLGMQRAVWARRALNKNKGHQE